MRSFASLQWTVYGRRLVGCVTRPEPLGGDQFRLEWWSLNETVRARACAPLQWTLGWPSKGAHSFVVIVIVPAD